MGVGEMKHSIVTKIIAIFILFGIVPLLTFNIIYMNIERRVNENMMKESLEKLVHEKSQVLFLIFEEVENEVENLDQWIEYQFAESNDEDVRLFMENYQIEYDEGGYVKNPSHLYSILQKKESTNIYMKQSAQINRSDIIELANIEKIGNHLSNTKDRLLDLGWIYFITVNDTMLISPSTDVGIFGNSHDFSKDIYYNIATPQNNPERNVVWTEPYYDWLGKGWMITCSSPIYKDEIFMGVVSADVPLGKISSIVADLRLSESGFTFLIDQRGNVIYHPDAIELSREKGAPLSMNMLAKAYGSEYADIYHSMTSGQKGFDLYTDEITNNMHAISYTTIEGFDLSLGIEVDWRSYQNLNLYTHYYLMAMIIPSIAIFMILGIFLFRIISMPIIHLSNEAEKIRQGDYTNIIEPRSTDEIGVLEHAFKEMTLSIRKYTQDLLHKNKEIEAIFDSFPGLLYIIDDNYRIKLMNKNGMRLLAKTDEVDLDSETYVCYEIIFNRRVPCQNCPKNHVNAFKGENITEISEENQFFRIRSYPIFSEKNIIQEWVLFNTEITEEFMMEKKVTQAEKLAGIGQTVAGVTHELKNPITVIKGAHHLLKDIFGAKKTGDDDDKAIIEILDQIGDSVQRSEATIHNLLDFSRQAVKVKEAVDIIKILNQVLILEGHEISKRNVNVVCDFENEMQMIWGNKDSLKHILLNLISNAIQAMPEKEAKLILKVRSLEDNRVEVKVIDNGEGIPESQECEIFEPFFTTKEEKGLGLGLWIAKKELEKVDGKIEVESNFGEGTEFTLVFSGQEMTK